MKQRNSFRFNRNFLEAIELLPESEQLALYRAIVRYGLYKEEPKPKDKKEQADIFFGLLKGQITAQWDRLERWEAMQAEQKGGSDE